jgi:hypothetical protein
LGIKKPTCYFGGYTIIFPKDFFFPPNFWINIYCSLLVEQTNVEPTGAWTQNEVTQNYSMEKALIKFGLLNDGSLYIKGLMAKDFELVNYIQIGPSCP